MQNRISVIIPVYNGEKYLAPLLGKLKKQSIKISEIIIADSSSTDRSLQIAGKYGVKIIHIKKENFDHGGTRTLAGKAARGDILVYLTQDALPVNNRSIENIVRPFSNKKTGAVYGRQIPYHEATPFAAHSRSFIYKNESFTRFLEDRGKYKIKTAFLSNAFSAYRRSAMEKIGYFKKNLISTEDTYAGAKLLLAGYGLAYAADAAVYHSHNYTAFQEFKRYFDIGAFHKIEGWIIKEFGKANDEGFQFIKSEFNYLLKNKKFHLIPAFFYRNGMKWLGYRLGSHYRLLPYWLIRKLSMHHNWWEKNKGMFTFFCSSNASTRLGKRKP